MNNANGWLQPPSLVIMPKHPPLEVFLDLDVDISELDQLDKLRRSAADSVAELTDRRPGGQTWREAHDDDVAATVAGKPANRLAKLLSGDPARWVSATVAVDAFTLATRAPLTELKLAVRTALRTKLAELEAELGDTAAAGWAMRHDKSVAWTHRTECDRLLAKWRTARALWSWTDGHPYAVNRDILPSGATAGFYWSLCWKLDGVRQPGLSTSGGDTVWPEGASEEVFGRQVSQFA